MTLELGTTSLSETRLARGLTLEDAERGTRISRRFLIALEEHNYSVFPAPVYARGFLRSYCRYLGVDPEGQLAALPAGWAASPPATYLPPISRGPIRLNMSWLFAGALVVAIVGLGLFFSRSGDNLGELQAQDQQQTPGEQGATVAADVEAAPQEQSVAASEETASGPGRVLETGAPGFLPDFLGVAVDEVTTFLDSQGIAYLRIDTRSSITPAGLVIAQSPAAGTSAADLVQVTLTVSAGTDIGPARTDCSVLEASNHRTIAEQAYFESDCGSSPSRPADRTDCEEIRGTDYRSPEERAFFLANCIIP